MPTEIRMTGFAYSSALLAALVIATAAAAHTHVKDANVRARMHTMSEIGDAAKTIGTMVKGERPFDPVAAAAAIREIERCADEIEERFRTEADDPLSEARPAIWTNWTGFAEKAGALRTAVRVADPTTLETLRQSFDEIGKACGDCHNTYRE